MSARLAGRGALLATTMSSSQLRAARLPRAPRTRLLHHQAGHLYAALNRTRFGGGLSPCDVRFSARLTASGGMCYPSRGQIRLSVHLLRDHGWEEVLEVLLHEMAHLWVYEHWPRKGRRRPRPHGPEFRGVLAAVGGRRLHCVPFASPRITRLHVYRCPQGHEFVRRRRLAPSLVCAACSRARLPARLRWVEQREQAS
jgi:predicted SprT family Zn-dependent metalloprotease